MDLGASVRRFAYGALAASSVIAGSNVTSQAQATQTSKPNIVVIMADDIGWSNIGVYNMGMMAGRTPNLDKMAKEGMIFTDYYAEASCTAGRAAFITGELPMPHQHRCSGARIGNRAAATDCCNVAFRDSIGL